DNAGALADLDQAVSLSPRAANAYYTRALVFSLNGQYRRAVEDATRALELRNNAYPEARLARADALLALGATQRAKDDLFQLDVAALDPALQDLAAQLKQRLVAP
ncbi:MAG TPA: tetratricopeptide repeat protein, partial [Roseiflexaceae bacterium]|nr:tetratricopeptide repeat protein [Roseiflexaceae bacterium]